MLTLSPDKQNFLNYVKEGRFYGRKEAAQDLQLSEATISNYTDEFLKNGVIKRGATLIYVKELS